MTEVATRDAGCSRIIDTLKDAGEVATFKFDKLQITADSDYYNIAKKIIFEAGYTAYDLVIKSVLEDVSCNLVANVLGGVSAGSVSAVIAAWNIGLMLGELVAPGDSDSIYYMYYIYPVEEALQSVLKKYANTLKSQKTYETACKYDVAFKTLKYTNVALYGKMYDFSSTKHLFWCKSQNMKNHMEAATFYKGQWQRRSCHLKDYDSMEMSKTVGVNCPVDVYLYNGNNELILAIVNEEITVYKDNRIAVDVCDGHKAINFSDDEDYRVKIIARENGTMEYNLISNQGEEIRVVEFNNISLTANQEFNATVPQDHNASTDEFSLETNGTEILPNYDSDNISFKCTCNCHKSGIVKFFFNIILFFQLIFKQNKTCACGVNHY